MAERGDAFVALPGGIGTFEELFEVWTWRQLGYHDKPIGLLNVAGYYDTLLDFMTARVDAGLRVARAARHALLQSTPTRQRCSTRLGAAGAARHARRTTTRRI